LLTVILALSVLLRVAGALYLGDTVDEIRGGTHDQISYDMLANRVASGHGFTFDRTWWPHTRAGEPTAHWSYLYTLYLAGMYRLLGHHLLIARLVQAVLVGLLMPYLLYRITRRVFDETVGLIAAAIAAVYLYFVHYAATLMTEAFYITALLWAVDLAMRLAEQIASPSGEGQGILGPGLQLGAAMAVALLLRQVGVFLLGVVCLWLIWLAWRRGQLRRIVSLLGVAGTMVLIAIAPWVVRNYLVFDVVTPLPNTNSGFAFFWANHPIYGTDFEAVLSPDHGVSYQELIPPELRHLNEAALDRALLRRGLNFVRQDPRRYLLLSLSRIPVYFMFWPTPNSSLLSNAARVLSFGVFFPFMLAGIFLALKDIAFRHRRSSSPKTPTDLSVGGRRGSSDPRPHLAVLLLLCALAYSGIHILSWANVRYRLPVDALLIPFAAYAIDHLLSNVPAVKTQAILPETEL
jgi:4-amino-4-deoxy-L-arabinose transferase-like glycosyltransferase